MTSNPQQKRLFRKYDNIFSMPTCEQALNTIIQFTFFYHKNCGVLQGFPAMKITVIKLWLPGDDGMFDIMFDPLTLVKVTSKIEQ